MGMQEGSVYIYLEAGVEAKINLHYRSHEGCCHGPSRHQVMGALEGETEVGMDLHVLHEVWMDLESLGELGKKVKMHENS